MEEEPKHGKSEVRIALSFSYSNAEKYELKFFSVTVLSFRMGFSVH